MRVDAGQLGEKDANPDGTLGDFEAEELFDCQAVAEIICERSEIVDAIGEGHDLLVKLGLAGFLDAGVKITDFRIEANNDFAVDFEHKAENAMGGRVLRSHIKDHVLVFGTFSSRSFEDRCAYVEHQRYPSTG
jgi:hypothetical protein